jgi:2,4-dienoyl-CoA reductase-like NADH-dependent reductase (Old Yellow Enzyme family)/thioredoxin reductase
MNAHYPHLFEPIRIGNKVARNRITQAGTTSSTGKDGQPTERTNVRYRRIAKGGIGVIVSESMRVHSSNTGRNETGFLLYRKEIIPAVEKLARAVKDEGALFVVQLNHGGRQHHKQQIPFVAGPSAIACPHSGGVPHQLSKTEITEIVQGFGKAALHAKLAGCDGVEIHGAQGHLIQEFISPFSNQRDDEYGGSFENRLRFAREIMTTIRENVGPDFIVGYRMGIEEFTEGGITVDDSRQAVEYFRKLGMIDFWSLVQGNFNTIDTHLPDAHYPLMPYVDIQAQIKAVAGDTPVIASTRITMPDQAETIIAQGKADMVALCRALIADPEWPQKAEEGRSEDICRCIATSFCWGGGTVHPLTCEVNTSVGRESDPPITRAEKPKRVVVVGAGPAGLEAATIAKQRGHDVVVLEKAPNVGGKLIFTRHYLPYHETSYALDYLQRRAEKAGVTIRTTTPGTRESVLAEKPDAVIVAAGSEIYAPKLAGDDSVKAVVYSKAEAGATVVVMDEDGYYWASCMTEQLARRGCKVIYVTRFNEPLRELVECSRISAIRAMDERGVKFYSMWEVNRCDRGDVVLRHYYNRKHEERIVGVADVVWVGAQRTNDQLVEELKAAGIARVQAVGDALMPRRLANATSEGYKAALAV